MNAAVALKLLDIVLLGVTLAPEAARAAERLADTLRRLDGEDPTPDQWDTLDTETDDLMADLRQRAEEARDN
ncbi:MAG: hypothetical protein ACTSX7_00105 [Alphaproteobacteria bacterium]